MTPLSISVRPRGDKFVWYFVSDECRDLWTDGVEYDTAEEANSAAGEARKKFQERQAEIDG